MIATTKLPKLRFKNLSDKNKGAQRLKFIKQVNKALDTMAAGRTSMLHDDRIECLNALKTWVGDKGFKSEHLGSGADRIVYSMPFNLVVKIPRFNERIYEQRAEWVTFKSKGGKDMATIYLYHEATSLLFMARANKVWDDATPEEKRRNSGAKKRIAGQFKDTHGGNIGRIGKRWVLIDASRC